MKKHNLAVSSTTVTLEFHFCNPFNTPMKQNSKVVLV